MATVGLRRQRGGVRGEDDHVVERELLDRRFHERAGEAGADAVLEFVELAHEVRRGAAGDAGNRTKAFQVWAMANGALEGAAGASGRGELFAFLNAAGRNVRGELRAR